MEGKRGGGRENYRYCRNTEREKKIRKDKSEIEKNIAENTEREKYTLKNTHTEKRYFR